MKIAKGKIGFEFTTVNTMEKGRSISISLENGPFKSLKGVWRFTPLGTHECIISLHFEFEFSNKLLGVALGGLFKQLCDSMVESFRKQAAVRYRWVISTPCVAGRRCNANGWIASPNNSRMKW